MYAERLDSFDIEFHQVFDRVSRVVNLKEAYGVNAVNQRIELVYHKLEGEKLDRRLADKRVPKWINYDQEQLVKLLKHDRFAERTTNELIAKPYGKVALTIRYGRAKAREILLRRARERHGRMRVIGRPKIRKRLM